MPRLTRNRRSQSRSFCLLPVSVPARPRLAAHVSPPDTDIAWPLIACAERAQQEQYRVGNLIGFHEASLRVEAGELTSGLRLRTAGVWQRSWRSDATSSGVSVKPGHTALTVMGRGANSAASARARPDHAMLGRAMSGGIGIAF